MNKKIKSKLKEIVGQNNFFDSNEDKLTYSYDATPIFNELPEAVIFPENSDQISSIIKLANTEKFNIVPRGAGTGLSGGSIPVENSIVGMVPEKIALYIARFFPGRYNDKSLQPSFKRNSRCLFDPSASATLFYQQESWPTC